MTRIRLDLSKHCIETEIKRLHNRAVSDYFKACTHKGSIEERIRLTQKALQILDFSKLRSTHAPLAGPCEAEVFLSEGAEGLSIFIDREKVSVRPASNGSRDPLPE